MKHKPIISYYANFDPTLNMDSWTNKITDINIITTKVITDKFINFVVHHKNKVFIHFVCNGTGGTVLEPNIPNLKQSFYTLKSLIDAGFPQKQILVIIKPVIQNDNGIKSIKLMMQLFSKFKLLKLRYVRIELLRYYKNDTFNKPKETIDNYSSIINTNKNKSYTYEIANKNISKRFKTISSKQIKHELLTKSSNFYREYRQLIDDYKAIITVDDENEPIIGGRELRALGYVANGMIRRVKGKPQPDNWLSNSRPIRCLNRCLLCPHQ